jgi:anaerobic selenocysteine-containing dehydrogenase
MSQTIWEGLVRTTCNMCERCCGVVAHVQDGKVTEVRDDPESPVNTDGLCPRVPTAVQYLYHPNRLKYPLKRAGSKGAGKWQRIPWDEALGTIADAMNSAKEEYGAESVAFVQGSPKGFGPYLERLRNLFGTPNLVAPNHLCSVPRRIGSIITYGQSPATMPDNEADIDFPPACVLIWGTNPKNTDYPTYVQLQRALAQGTKLIVVDPRRTGLASQANVWLQVRPGTDLALAMAMINVIISEELYDKSFVANWTVGFDKLKKHIESYTPQRVAEITWVPAEKIIEGARIYAKTRPASIRDGNGFEEKIDSVQTARALSILRAITGNLSVPGGNTDWAGLPVLSVAEFTLSSKLPKEQRRKRLGADRGFVPMSKAEFVPSQLLIKAIIDEKPYPIRVASIHGSNPMVTFSNTKEVRQALMKLNFLAVADLFMTPTAELADVVLPVATYLEVNDVYVRPPILSVRQKIASVGDCWSDQKIINELGKKLGFKKYFWGDVEEALDFILKPTGITFAELLKIAPIKVGREYRKYVTKGFDTPSGKVEIYSSLLEKWGHEPLPTYHEPPETPDSAPELVSHYPLIMTSWHNFAFHHSDNRQLTSLRDIEQPFMEIHPETAKELGIADGDEVYIETKRGRIKQLAKLSDALDPRVVGVAYAWWFPEQSIQSLHGWAESNLNILTESGPPYNPQIGSTNLRGMLCRVYKLPVEPIAK